MKNFTVKFLLTITALLTFGSVGAFAQGGCIIFPTPQEYQGNSGTNVYRVASGINATGTPVTTTPISTDSTLATTVTQPVTVPNVPGTPITICAPAGPYTLQFNTSIGGGGYFNYNIIVPADETKMVASVAKIVDGTDNTKVLNFQASGATTATTTTLATATAASTTLTLPQGLAGANAGGIPVVYSCGSTGSGNQTCTAAAPNAKTTIFEGESTLATNSAVITLPNAFAYTSTTTYFCIANDVTTRANPVQAVPTTASTFTITDTTGASDVIQWICVGQ